MNIRKKIKRWLEFLNKDPYMDYRFNFEEKRLIISEVYKPDRIITFKTLKEAEAYLEEIAEYYML